MNEIIQSHLALSEESARLLMKVATEKTVEKNEVLFFPDKQTKKIVFIKKGLLRGYKIVDGKDYTHHFYLENWFATDFLSFLNEEPSQIFIESIEKTTFYEFNKKDFLTLYNTSHELERMGRIIAERAYLATVEKMANLQLLDLSERYKALMKRARVFFKEFLKSTSRRILEFQNKV